MGFLGDFGESLLGKVVDFGFDSATGAINNYYNRKAASTANKYALYQSGSAHQREVKDLRLAGLNPVLSAMGNGAATVSIPVHGGQQPQSSSMSSNIQANSAKKVGEAQVNLLEAQKEQANTASLKNLADIGKANADTQKANADAARVNNDNAILALRLAYLKDKIRKGRFSGTMPFDNEYYGSGILGINSTVRDVSRMYENSADAWSINFQGFENFLRNLFSSRDAGSHGGRNSAKTIELERKDHKRAIEWLKKKRPSGAF